MTLIGFPHFPLGQSVQAFPLVLLSASSVYLFRHPSSLLVKKKTKDREGRVLSSTAPVSGFNVHGCLSPHLRYAHYTRFEKSVESSCPQLGRRYSCGIGLELT